MLRKNINRIDHIAICVRPENLTSAVEHFSELLDISFEGPFESAAAGVTYYLDWDSGMEVYAPSDQMRAADRVEFLERRGEGVFRVIFGVPDLRKAVERAQEMGYDAPYETSAFNLNPEWHDRFQLMDEALFAKPVYGVRLAFSQIEPHESELS